MTDGAVHSLDSTKAVDYKRGTNTVSVVRVDKAEQKMILLNIRLVIQYVADHIFCFDITSPYY